MQEKLYCKHDSLLEVNKTLEYILSGACKLLEVHKLATKGQNGSDLHAVLGQNVLDLCNWVSHSRQTQMLYMVLMHDYQLEYICSVISMAALSCVTSHTTMHANCVAWERRRDTENSSERMNK